MTSVEGFVLQATYRVHGGAPVVHLYGTTTHGESFLVRDHRQTPHFYIPTEAASLAESLGAKRQRPTKRRAFDGRPVTRIDVAIPQDTPALRDRISGRGIDVFEADVRFAVRYLIDRNIRGGCRITGTPKREGRIAHVFDDPDIEPSQAPMHLRTLSFDIETTPDAEKLLAIAIYGENVDEVLVVDDSERQMPPGAIAFANEREALDAFCQRVWAADPDVLTGWNVIDFDLTVLSKIARRVRYPLFLGRDQGAPRIRPAQGYFGSGQANIPGRVVLDGMDLVRGAFLRFDDYSLDTVASKVLGEGKVDVEGELAKAVFHDSDDATPARAQAIVDRYMGDLDTFVRYARTDARLALEILQALDLLDLAVARSRLTGMTPDRVSASIASFDFLYMAALHPKGIVAPSVQSSDSRVSEHQAGGHVFEPTTGVHDHVAVFDFKSLYPSLMRTFNIDPLAFVAPDATNVGDAIRATEHAAFRRGDAILPQMLDELTAARDAAKVRGDGVASQAIKILMNSCYGVLGTPACRFHNVHIANAITGLGRRFLIWSKRWFEERGYAVLYGDTDSVFVRLVKPDEDVRDEEAIRALARGLTATLNTEVAAYIEREWGVTSRLEMEFEKLYRKLFLPSVRHGAGGARKRYAGLLEGRDEVEFVGMEVVRRDWTDLAKLVQRELYDRLFHDRPVDEYLAEIAVRLRGGELDDLLVYRKGLRKSVRAYTANTPPHVAAARKSKSTSRVVSYVITQAGPEPLDALHHEPDREHYLAKQVRPVAEPVLAVLGQDFDRVVGDDRQMALF